MKCVSKLIFLAVLGTSANSYELRGTSTTSLNGAMATRAKKGSVMIYKEDGGHGGGHGTWQRS